MNGTDFKTSIATYFNRDDLTSQIATAAALAVKKLERNKFWFQLASTTIACSSGVSYASMPSGFIDVIYEGFKDTNGRSLKKSDWATLDTWITYSGGTGEPNNFAIADKFYFYPIPDSTYALPLQYYKSLGFPGDTSSNAWTDTVYDLTYWATIEEVWRYLRNTQEQMKAEQQKNTVLRQVKSQSGKLTGKGRVEYKEF